MHTLLTPSQLGTLCKMLSSCRPYGSQADQAFCREYLAPLPGISQDIYGNWIGDIGETPAVLWSSHTDTVHRFSGAQTLHVDHEKQTIKLSRRSRKRSNCLGADDTVGVFLMREMYLAGVPGRYIFHYGEECGCIGSSDLAQYSPETLAGISFAIALDRAGTSDVITSQYGDVCCSDTFAQSLIIALGLDMETERGVFTDTAQYMDLIPECTNLSVGYYHQHTSAEYVDFGFVGILLAALVQMDQALLICTRDPFAPKPKPRFDWGKYDRKDTPAVIDRVDGNTSRGLWRDGWNDQSWCYTCDAPLIDEDDPNFHDLDHCVCTPEDEQYTDDDDDDDLDLMGIDTHGLTADDIAFLKHLRGLD